MDLYDRRITGIRLRPIAAQSPDVASVLFQTVTPQTWGWEAGAPQGPYGGLLENLVVADPGGVLPETIVVEHGKISEIHRPCPQHRWIRCCRLCHRRSKKR